MTVRFLVAKAGQPHPNGSQYTLEALEAIAKRMKESGKYEEVFFKGDELWVTAPSKSMHRRVISQSGWMDPV